MEARQSPVYLRSVAQAVTDFRAAFVRLLELYVPFELARGVAPAIVPRDDADEGEIDRRRQQASVCAGRAAVAAPLTGLYIEVQGIGRVDPISAWQSVTKPKPVVEPDDVLDACDQALGRLETMIVAAEVETAPLVGAEGMHPLVWGAARKLWRDGHFREAVAGAAQAVIGHVRAVTGRHDATDTALWQEVFSPNDPAPQKPRLRWPGDPGDQTVRTMNAGLLQFAPGAQMTIRNPAAHSTDDFSEQDGLERLAVLSLLARWVEECQLIEEAPTTDVVGPST